MFGKKNPSGSAQGMELQSVTPNSATLGSEATNPARGVQFADDTDGAGGSSRAGGLGARAGLGQSIRGLIPAESQAYKNFSSRRYKKKLAGEKFESFDYDAPDDRYRSYFSTAKKGDLVAEAEEVGKERVRENKKRDVFRWLNLLIIGVVTGNVAYWMTVVVSFLITIKWHDTWEYLQAGDTAKAYFYYLGWVFACTLAAGLLAYWAPESAGSGIPQVKAYLNGNQISGLLRFKTFVAKTVGITVCVTSGMPAGREGPMVHAGSILAAGLARGYSDALPFLPGIYNGFDNTRDRRDFVSMGAAAGVAAAFNAPIGGILFSLEEVSSVWSGALTWQTFVCAIVAAYTVNLLMASGAGSFSDSSLVLFGHDDCGEKSGEYEVWEVGMFIIIAILGGLVGSAYVWVNEHLTMMRKKFWAGKNPAWRIVEALVIVCTILTMFFFIPMLFECKHLPDWAGDADDSHRKLAGYHSLVPIQYNCEAGYYNEMATLLLTPQETTILQLYSRNTYEYFDIPTLAVFTVFFFFCAVTAYGIAVPAGLFIPSMMIGAGMGRLFGEIVNGISGEHTVDPGFYGLIGAAAVLGGITRMTISLTVIMVEITNNINYMLPIMLSVAISKAVGDHFTESLYDVHMELAGIPYIESEPPQVYDALTAECIMSPNVVRVRQEPSIAEIQECLATTHNAFPVRNSDDRFAGMVTRAQLEEALDQGGSVDITLSTRMDHSPFIVQRTVSLRRVLRLFRGMGLRHIPVVDINGGNRQVIGMISRKDFLDTPNSLSEGLLDSKFEKVTRAFMKDMEGFQNEAPRRRRGADRDSAKSKKGDFVGGL